MISNTLCLSQVRLCLRVWEGLLLLPCLHLATVLPVLLLSASREGLRCLRAPPLPRPAYLWEHQCHRNPSQSAETSSALHLRPTQVCDSDNNLTFCLVFCFILLLYRWRPLWQNKLFSTSFEIVFVFPLTHTFGFIIKEINKRDKLDNQSVSPNFKRNCSSLVLFMSLPSKANKTVKQLN